MLECWSIEEGFKSIEFSIFDFTITPLLHYSNFLLPAGPEATG